ncbi:MAG: hypothetical protein F6K53_31920 [Moorea sp. SIO4A1]|nr:hypothetical protein [Moorena sp. SIO4A1]
MIATVNSPVSKLARPSTFNIVAGAFIDTLMQCDSPTETLRDRSHRVKYQSGLPILHS